MNRAKLQRRTAKAEQLHARWRAQRIVDRMVRGTMFGMMAELAKPSLFAHLGSARHFEYPGGRRVGLNVFDADHST